MVLSCELGVIPLRTGISWMYLRLGVPLEMVKESTGKLVPTSWRTVWTPDKGLVENEPWRAGILEKLPVIGD